MKTFLLLFTSVLVSVGVSKPKDALSTNDIFEETLTFDGYEGDYFFFTNLDDKSLVLAMDEHTVFGKSLIENNDIKNRFNVTYKLLLTEEDVSSSGILIKVSPQH